MSVADTASEIRLYGLTPEEIITACGHFVTIKLQNNDTQSGYLYVIDPVNKSVILKHETQDIAIVILRHQIVSIEGMALRYLCSKIETNANIISMGTVNHDQPAKVIVVTNEEQEDIIEDSAAMQNRKRNAIELLETVKKIIR